MDFFTTSRVGVVAALLIFGVVFALTWFLLDVIGAAIALMFRSLSKYFRSPSDGKVHLDWALRQFFVLFSTRAGTRWYEARVFIHSGLFVSLMCAFGICEVVRYLFVDQDEDHTCSVYQVHWLRHIFTSNQEIKQLLYQQVSSVQQKIKGSSLGKNWCLFIFHAGSTII